MCTILMHHYAHPLCILMHNPFASNASLCICIAQVNTSPALAISGGVDKRIKQQLLIDLLNGECAQRPSTCPAHCPSPAPPTALPLVAPLTVHCPLLVILTP